MEKWKRPPSFDSAPSSSVNSRSWKSVSGGPKRLRLGSQTLRLDGSLAAPLASEFTAYLQVSHKLVSLHASASWTRLPVRSDAFRLEEVAVNEATFRIPDVDGAKLTHARVPDNKRYKQRSNSSFVVVCTKAKLQLFGVNKTIVVWCGLSNQKIWRSS